MFREMRRFKQQVSLRECQRILSEEKRAAFSVNGDDGYPYTIPIDFYYDKEENKIYFHGAVSGHKVDSLKANDKVCFTIWNQGFIKEGAWEYNATSVVVFGKAHLITDTSVRIQKLRKLALKYYPDSAMPHAEDELSDEGTLSRTAVFAIDIEHMTGKLVNEK